MTWQMDFNMHISKCNILQITIPMHCSINNFVYKMRDTPLMKVDQYYCIYIYKTSNHGLPTLTIFYIKHKANCLLGFLNTSLKNSPRYFKEYAYKQLVLPSIEYCCSTWDPYQQYLIDKLEMIQQRAARFVLNKPWNRHQHDNITDMLKELNWPSLQKRRKQSHLILMYKINHLATDCSRPMSPYTITP